ncbi:MAG: D-dependent protein deacetylase of family [Firmicutes bacterium]|nr:D-dependent protein deacetylase of family [Bacillota bacterium]
MDDQIKILQDWVDNSNSILCLSGKGLSQESGVPDFFQTDENYYKTYDFPPEAIWSRGFIEHRVSPFFRFYRERVLAPLVEAEPNAAHIKLAQLENAGKLRAILTQNMDNLHQEAGNRKVLELFGSVMRNKCPLCEQRLPALDILERGGVPYCPEDMCGGVISPQVVLYGDPLDHDLVTDGIFQVLSADMVIVAGCSLTDYPAVAFAHYFYKKKLVLLGDAVSSADVRANLIVRGSVAEILDQIVVNP